MTDSRPNRLPKNVVMDLRWLLGFLTLVAAIMYVVVLVSVPALRKPAILIPFTGLLALHLTLHWLMLKIPPRTFWITGYFIVQGVLFFAISLLCGSANMIFTLFPAMIGESIGSLGFNRRGIAASLFFIGLLLASFFLLFTRQTALWLNIGTLAIVVSVVMYTALYRRQTDARNRAQALLEELEVAHRQLEEYAAQVEELTTAAERQRMARELHDTLSQGLAGLILQLEAVEAHLEAGRLPRALPIVRQAKDKARAALAESRQAIADLRQAGQPDLAAAARQEADRFTAATGIPCTLDLAVPAELPEPVAEAAVRAVAEGLTNIARHSRATKTRLCISAPPDSGELRLEIGDDGVGFDPEAIQAGHYGLLGMRERARLAGGGLEVLSRPGHGTCLVIRLPLKRAADA